jgi:hypothetical protein
LDAVLIRVVGFLERCWGTGDDGRTIEEYCCLDGCLRFGAGGFIGTWRWGRG